MKDKKEKKEIEVFKNLMEKEVSNSMDDKFFSKFNNLEEVKSQKVSERQFWTRVIAFFIIVLVTMRFSISFIKSIELKTIESEKIEKLFNNLK